MLQPEDFEPHLGRTFLAHLPTGEVPVPLELRSCQRHAERTHPWLRRPRPFSLGLSGPAQRALHPGTYEVAWPDDSRRQAMFIQIIAGSGPHAALYEVIFN